MASSLFSNQRVLVMGLGKSGMATLRTLHRLGVCVSATDRLPAADSPFAAELAALGIPYVLGTHPLSLLDETDVIVKSPGIPYTDPFLAEAVHRNMRIITEPELAFWLTETPFIGITGTNGKTTTTLLTAHFLRSASFSALSCGNIGTPVLEAVQQPAPDWLVCELSSFQLAGVQDFRPRIACFLNLSDTHLDYHVTPAHYAASKWRLFARQSASDFAILNADVPAFCAQAPSLAASVYWFSARSRVPRGVFAADHALWFQPAPDEPAVYLFPLSAILLPGHHNVENVMAAALAALLAGTSPAALAASVSSFSAVEHRLEHVACIHGVDFYNDSKSTNPAAAAKALESFQRPIVYIAGGLDRGTSFEELVPALSSQPVKSVIVYGDTAPKIREAAERAGIASVYEVASIKDSVSLSRTLTTEGDVVLLSPACASWGMYRSFEERGRDFKFHVSSLGLLP